MKKIMFNDRYGLMQAVLEGRKTMTRRIIKGNFEGVKAYHANGDWHFIADTKDGDSVEVKPAYEVGETIAIAQAYNTLRWSPLAPGIDLNTINEVTHAKGWTNKMFVKAKYMPHRIRITGIKVERLQDIREEDCLREGIKKMEEGVPYRFDDNEKIHLSADLRMLFEDLIDRISGRGTWQRNPWVYAYTFELIK